LHISQEIEYIRGGIKAKLRVSAHRKFPSAKTLVARSIQVIVPGSGLLPNPLIGGSVVTEFKRIRTYMEVAAHTSAQKKCDPRGELH
jgi:hypothetical protein